MPLHTIITIITIIFAFIALPASSTLLSLTSTSDVVGASQTNFTFQISNITLAARIRFNLDTWSFLTSNSYSSSTKCYLGTTEMSASFLGNLIQCRLSPVTGSNQSLSFMLSNMLNPSSTKPYYINITFLNSNNTEIVSYNYLNTNRRNSLNATRLTNITFFPSSYSTRIGASNTNVSFDIQMNNYIDSNTILLLQFNSTLIVPNFASTTSYNAVATTGAVNIRNWSTNYLNAIKSQGYLTLTGIAINNPAAAISYTISGVLYFVESGVNYTIQTVFSSITLNPISFTTFAITTPLAYGILTAIDINSSCSLPQVNSSTPSTPAYHVLSYNSSQLAPSNTSNCSTLTSSTCRTTDTNNYRLTNFQTTIDSSTTTPLTLTSFTFYQGIYYSLCRSTFTISLTQQLITPSLLTSQCDTNQTNTLNTINLYITLGSALAGDIVYLYGFKAQVRNTNVWASLLLNNQVVYQSILSTSYYTNSTTNMTLSLPFSYLNLNQTSVNMISKVEIYRNMLKYAETNSNLNTSLCPITNGKSIISYSIASTNLSTYTPTTISISPTLQIFDYNQNDTLKLTFLSTSLQRDYIFSASLISPQLSPSISINSIQCNYTILNNYEMMIMFHQNVVFPTASNPLLIVEVRNVMNPVVVGSFWIKLVTYDYPNNGVKEELTTSILSTVSRSLGYSMPNVYLLKNNTFSFDISNPNRQILIKNTTFSATTLTITLPSSILCSNYNNASTITSSWNYLLNTITNNSVGDVSNIKVQLGSCYIRYFTGNLIVRIVESLNGVTSTISNLVLGNICGDNCFECNSSGCTNCFNITNSNFTLLYKNTCLSSCPSKSYLSVTSCIDCHASCSICNGSTYLNCTKCQTTYVLNNNFCQSICGTSKYQINGACQACHPNCNSCINASNCYVCKQNATLIGSVCQFTKCFEPCSSCLGSQSTCTTCINGKYLYLSQCVDKCPTNSYAKQEGNMYICSIISESVTYMPVSICGLVCVLLIIALRAYSNKKIGNQSRRILQYSSHKDINYKLNILRLSSIVFSYLEIVAAVVLLFKNRQFQIEGNVVLIIVIGIALHVLCNLAFFLGFLRILRKNVVDNENFGTIESGQSTRPGKRHLSFRFKLILALSSIISLRTYKILYSNAFLDRQPQKQKVRDSKLQQTDNNLTNNIQSTLNKKQKNMVDFHKSNHKSKDKMKQDIVPSRKPIRTNSLGDQQNQGIKRTQSIVVQEDKEDVINHQLTHPFLTYLIIITLFTGSLIIIIASSLELYNASFLHMILWGLDCLFVTICSFALTAWDLWIFTNLLKEEQNSEMSSKEEREREREGDRVNNTHENLKQEMQVDIKISPKQMKKSITKSYKQRSYNKPSLSKRSEKSKDQASVQEVKNIKPSQQGSKRQRNQEIKIQNIPVLKIFDDFEQQEYQNANPKQVRQLRQTKSKKFTTSKEQIKQSKQPNRQLIKQQNRQQYKQQYNQQIKQSKQLMNFKKSNKKVNHVASRNNRYSVANDLFVNFQTTHQSKTINSKSFNHNRDQMSPNRSVQQQSIKVEGQFSEHPPIFPDISEIEQAKPQEAINHSISQVIIEGNQKVNLYSKNVQQASQNK